MFRVFLGSSERTIADDAWHQDVHVRTGVPHDQTRENRQRMASRCLRVVPEQTREGRQMQAIKVFLDSVGISEKVYIILSQKGRGAARELQHFIMLAEIDQHMVPPRYFISVF